MQLSLNTKGYVDISEGAIRISCDETAVTLNEYVIDFPGEYERNLVFAEVRETKSGLIWILTLEGKTIIYLPISLTADVLESLRDINNKDMAIFPASESLWKVIETWELAVAVPYGPGTHDFLAKLWQVVEVTSPASVKAADFESEKTRFVSLG